MPRANLRHDIMKVLMLMPSRNKDVGTRGDTLIEVTISLAILSIVLMGAAGVATSAFRLGQTARERTTMVEEAQEQMEALHNFRDNHTWNEFRDGSGCGSVGYCGLHSVTQGGVITRQHCQLANLSDYCFYMQKYPIGTPGGPTGWVPVPGTLSNAAPDSHSTQLDVPTSKMEIVLSPETLSDLGSEDCEFDVELHYAFIPLGKDSSQKASNDIKTRLVNLKYNPGPVPPDCPA